MLFDHDGIPDLTGLTAEGAWAACEEFEDYVYLIGDDVSVARFDYLLRAARDLYDEYYRLYE